MGTIVVEDPLEASPAVALVKDQVFVDEDKAEAEAEAEHEEWEDITHWTR